MRDQPLMALGWMTLCSLLFALMQVFVKALTSRLDSWQVLFFRFAVNAVIVLFIVLRRGDPLLPSTRGLLLFRGAAGFVGATCLFYSVSHLPLPMASILAWSSPVFVLIFSHFLLGERVGGRALVWIAMAFVGVVLLVRPDFSTGQLGVPILAVGVAILGAASSGLAYTAVRAATAQVGPHLIIFYLTWVGTLLSAPGAVLNYREPTPSEWTGLLCVGVLASAAQFAMTQGYRYAQAGLVSSMNLMNAVFSAFLGWMIFGESLAPVQWLGMLLVGWGVMQVAGIRLLSPMKAQ